MDYELAKQLKDAGCSQTYEIGSEYYVDTRTHFIWLSYLECADIS